MNRNDKNRKYTPLNINNVFKGKTVEPQNRPSYKLGGMQNIGKVSSMRRVPPPKWVPSLKAETGVSDGRQIINQSSLGWVNPVSSQDNCDSSTARIQGVTSKIGTDKSQWTSKLASNKPFFLIGQEFPSLQSEGGHEISQDNNPNKDNIKLKDSDSNKSKIDELRNRDANISVSTLNRIDALSISKSTKGDIAATGWAAEDEEPNFDEKINFSDDDSSNEIQNWHSDNDDGSKSERCENRELVDVPPLINDVWHDQSQAIRFSQFQQMQLPVNVPAQFITNQQFPQNIIQRNPPGAIANIDEQAAFMNSVTEQRNARNMEYFIAIERARQKKFATQSSRGSCGIDDQNNQLDQALMRSRHTSMTSDTTESMNTPIEMGPPGGPPLIHHLHKPHLQPQMSPMMHPHNISVLPPSIPPQSLLRYAQHPYNIMPMPAVQMDPVDTKLMEKFVEFLKMQSNNEMISDNIIMSQSEGPSMDQPTLSTCASIVHELESKNVSDNCQIEYDRPQSHLSSSMSHGVSQIDKEQHPYSSEKMIQLPSQTVTGSTAATAATLSPAINIGKDNIDSNERESQRKLKSNYSYEEDNGKYDSSKKGNKSKNFKEYRPNNKGVYKGGDYPPLSSTGIDRDRDIRDRDYYPENNDELAYEDYNTYKQHYSREYKSSRGYSRNQPYSYYSPDPYSSQSRDNFMAASDYQYKSNSLKLKSKSKDVKLSGSNIVEHSSLEREPSSTNNKKFSATESNLECWPHDNDVTDPCDKKQTKDNNNKDIAKKNANKQSSKQSSYQNNKKYENSRTSHKDKQSSEAPQPEYSMGFAVNPKDSRKNYYSSSNYNRRYYSDYNSSKYYNNYGSSGVSGNGGSVGASGGGSKYGASSTDYDTAADNYHHHSHHLHHSHAHYQDNSYYGPQDYFIYDNRDVSYSSNSKYGSITSGSKQRSNNKMSTSITNTSSNDQWRVLKDDKGNANSATTSFNHHQSKMASRSNRKSDKRQFSTSKDSNNDNDQDEWETASEGGSIKSNSAPRDVQHKMHNRQNNSQVNTGDNGKSSIQNSSNNNENRKVAMNKSGSNYSCNGGNNSFNDNNGNQDGSDGASGSAGGARYFSSTGRSNVSQSRTVDSTQNKSMDKTSNNENRNSDNSSKNCSNNNNSNKDNSKFNNADSRLTESGNRISDSINLATTMNIEKFPDLIEDEDLLYENVESQFQEVVSKATKKNRKLEEQKRQKEEIRLEQKRLEALKYKSKVENNQIRKQVNRRDQLQRTNKCEPASVHKFENKSVANIRDKEIVSNNTFKKWENNKTSMQIGSWDNSLADAISSEKKAPPKPIGTPASSVPWNKKVKGSYDNNSTINICQNTSNDSIKLPAEIETLSQSFIVSSENSETNFNTSYSYNNSIYNSPPRTTEENKIETSIETQPNEIAIHDISNFEYDVKNINCDNKNHRNSLTNDRNLQNNDQKLLNDKINSVKTIWDNQPTSSIAMESKVTVSSSINQDIVDIHTVSVTISQDVSNTRNIVDSNLVSASVPIPNVCKVKPQLQHDFKKDHSEIIITSQAFPFRNSPATFLSQNQGSFMPYHRFPDFISADPLHASADAFASLISNNQSGMHINYNLPNTHHLIDSSMLRQSNAAAAAAAQEQMLSNKMNFINHTQSSFYPQQATTPKLMSNTAAQMPINMDMSNAHGPPPHHMQQLLLTRQNSLTSMMQPNQMTIPFLQSGQQPIQAQTPLFPTTPLLGATNFSSQLNPFSQAHLQPHPYTHAPNFQSLHAHNAQFQPHNQQMLLNQHHAHQHHSHQHQQQQQIIQGPLSHDRVISSGQSGVFNSVIGPSDISTNTGLPDFNGQPKPLNHHHNNIMHGMNGSAFMLPHNLNILMKPPMFATNSQYNNFTTPIQSNLLSLKAGFEHNSNLKSVDIDHYKHDNSSINERNIFCTDNSAMQKSNDDYYQDVSEYENCDINYDNWLSNMRYSKVDIYTTNNLMSTFDFHSQKSPMQFSPMEPGNETAYRNYIAPFRDNHASLSAGLAGNTNLQYIISPRIKQPFNQEQSAIINRQHSKCYDNNQQISFISTNNNNNNNNNSNNNNFLIKNELTDNNNKISIKNSSSCTNTNVTNDVKDNLTKDISNIEKSITDSKKSSKQRTSYSDNFDEKNQAWSLIEDDRSGALDDNRTSLKSNNTETNSHSPNKHFNNNTRSSNSFDNQCQYGYDETQLSSQTAESLGKYDPDQLKEVIMKLREGPVMTDTNCNEFDFTSYKVATIPRLMPLQSSRNKPTNTKSFNNYTNSFSSDSNNYGGGCGGDNNVGLGFYSRNRALTPPAAQFRTYRNKNNRNNQNSVLSTINNNNNNAAATSTSINRVSRQKCDTNNDKVVVMDSVELKLNSIQSKSLECDNLVLENIIDSPIL